MSGAPAEIRSPSRVRLVPHPKPGGARWITVLDGPTAAAYRSLVAGVARHIELRLPSGVIANRVLPAPTGILRLEPWRAARRRFLLEARTRARATPVLLVADVRRCFPSIRPAVVGERLLDVGCRPAEAHALVRLLDDLSTEGVAGLPIGPEPSAVLANGVLEHGDRAVERAGAEHLRWVDDFLVFARATDHALAVLESLRTSLAHLGLALAEEKTRVIEDRDEAREAIAVGSEIRPRL